MAVTAGTRRAAAVADTGVVRATVVDMNTDQRVVALQGHSAVGVEVDAEKLAKCVRYLRAMIEVAEQ